MTGWLWEEKEEYFYRQKDVLIRNAGLLFWSRAHVC